MSMKPVRPQLSPLGLHLVAILVISSLRFVKGDNRSSGVTSVDHVSTAAKSLFLPASSTLVVPTHPSVAITTVLSSQLTAKPSVNVAMTTLLSIAAFGHYSSSLTVPVQTRVESAIQSTSVDLNVITSSPVEGSSVSVSTSPTRTVTRPPPSPVPPALPTVTTAQVSPTASQQTDVSSTFIFISTVSPDISVAVSTEPLPSASVIILPTASVTTTIQVTPKVSQLVFVTSTFSFLSTTSMVLLGTSSVRPTALFSVSSAASSATQLSSPVATMTVLPPLSAMRSQTRVVSPVQSTNIVSVKTLPVSDEVIHSFVSSATTSVESNLFDVVTTSFLPSDLRFSSTINKLQTSFSVVSMTKSTVMDASVSFRVPISRTVTRPPPPPVPPTLPAFTTIRGTPTVSHPISVTSTSLFSPTTSIGVDSAVSSTSLPSLSEIISPSTTFTNPPATTISPSTLTSIPTTSELFTVVTSTPLFSTSSQDVDFAISSILLTSQITPTVTATRLPAPVTTINISSATSLSTVSKESSIVAQQFSSSIQSDIFAMPSNLGTTLSTTVFSSQPALMSLVIFSSLVSTSQPSKIVVTATPSPSETPPSLPQSSATLSIQPTGTPEVDQSLDSVTFGFPSAIQQISTSLTFSSSLISVVSNDIQISTQDLLTSDTRFVSKSLFAVESSTEPIVQLTSVRSSVTSGVQEIASSRVQTSIGVGLTTSSVLQSAMPSQTRVVSPVQSTATSVESRLFDIVTTSILPPDVQTSFSVVSVTKSASASFAVPMSRTVTRPPPPPVPPALPTLTTIQVTPTVSQLVFVTSASLFSSTTSMGRVKTVSSAAFPSLSVSISKSLIKPTPVSDVSSDIFLLETSSTRPTTLFSVDRTKAVSSATFSSFSILVLPTPAVSGISSDVFLLETSSIRPTALLSAPSAASSYTQSSFMTTLTLISSSLPVAVPSETVEFPLQSTAIVSTEFLSVSSEVSHSVTSAAVTSVQSTLFPDIVTSVVPQFSSTVDTVETSIYVRVTKPTATHASVSVQISPTVTRPSDASVSVSVSQTVAIPPPPPVPPPVPTFTTIQVTPTVSQPVSVTSTSLFSPITSSDVDLVVSSISLPSLTEIVTSAAATSVQSTLFPDIVTTSVVPQFSSTVDMVETSIYVRVTKPTVTHASVSVQISPIVARPSDASVSVQISPTVTRPSDASVSVQISPTVTRPSGASVSVSVSQTVTRPPPPPVPPSLPTITTIQVAPTVSQPVSVTSTSLVLPITSIDVHLVVSSISLPSLTEIVSPSTTFTMPPATTELISSSTLTSIPKTSELLIAVTSTPLFSTASQDIDFALSSALFTSQITPTVTATRPPLPSSQPVTAINISSTTSLSTISRESSIVAQQFSSSFQSGIFAMSSSLGTALSTTIFSTQPAVLSHSSVIFSSVAPSKIVMASTPPSETPSIPLPQLSATLSIQPTGTVEIDQSLDSVTFVFPSSIDQLSTSLMVSSPVISIVSSGIQISTQELLTSDTPFVSKSLSAVESSTEPIVQSASVRSSLVTSGVQEIASSSVQTSIPVGLTTSSFDQTTTSAAVKEATEGPVSSTELLTASFSSELYISSSVIPLLSSPVLSKSLDTTPITVSSIEATGTQLSTTSTPESVQTSSVLSASALPVSTLALSSASSLLLNPNISTSSLPMKVQASTRTSLDLSAVTMSASSQRSTSTSDMTLLPSVTAASVPPVDTNSTSVLPLSRVTFQSSTIVSLTLSAMTVTASPGLRTSSLFLRSSLSSSEAFQPSSVLTEKSVLMSTVSSSLSSAKLVVGRTTSLQSMVSLTSSTVNMTTFLPGVSFPSLASASLSHLSDTTRTTQTSSASETPVTSTPSSSTTHNMTAFISTQSSPLPASVLMSYQINTTTLPPSNSSLYPATVTPFVSQLVASSLIINSSVSQLPSAESSANVNSTVSPHTTTTVATTQTTTLQITPSTFLLYSIPPSVPLSPSITVTELVTSIPPTTSRIVSTVIPTVGNSTDFQAEIEIIVTNLRQSINTDEWKALIELNLEIAYLEAREQQSLQTPGPPAESNGGASQEQARKRRSTWEWPLKSTLSRSKRQSDTVDVTVVSIRQTTQDTTVVTFTIVDGGVNIRGIETCNLFNPLGIPRLSEILGYTVTVACRVVGTVITEFFVGGGDDGLETWLIVVITVGLFLVLFLLGGLYCCWKSRYTGKHRISSTRQTMQKEQKVVEDGSTTVALKMYRDTGADQLTRRMPATTETRFQIVPEKEEDEEDGEVVTPPKRVSPPVSSGTPSLIDVKPTATAEREIVENVRMPPAPRESSEDIFAQTETPPGEYNDSSTQHPAALAEPSAHMSTVEQQPKQHLRRYSSLRGPPMIAASAWSPNEDTSTSHTPSSEQLAAGNGVVQAVTGDKNNTGMFARQIALDEFQREHQQKEEQIDEQTRFLHQQEMQLQQAMKQKAEMERWRNKQRQRDKERTLNREQHRREQRKWQEEKSQELLSRKRQQQKDWSKAQNEFGDLLDPEATQLDALTAPYMSKPRRKHSKPRHWKRSSKTGPHPLADTVRQPRDLPRSPERLRRPEEMPRAHKTAVNNVADSRPVQAPQGAWLPPQPEVAHTPPVRILQVQPQDPQRRDTSMQASALAEGANLQRLLAQAFPVLSQAQTGQQQAFQPPPSQQQTTQSPAPDRRPSRSAPALRQAVHVTPQWTAPPARATFSRPRSASVSPYYPPVMVQPQRTTRSPSLPQTDLFAARPTSHAWEVPLPEGATREPSGPVGASQPQAAAAPMPQPQQAQETVHVTPVRRLANAQGQSTWSPYNPYQGYRETLHDLYTPHEPAAMSPYRHPSQDQHVLPIHVGTGNVHYPSRGIADNQQPLLDAITEELLRLQSNK